jgi:outer membrane biosynthesis protein TonB
MASGKTPRRRTDRPGEPDSGAPAEDVAVSDSNTTGSSSEPNASAADIYAEHDAWPSGPIRNPETDAAVSAASAAAAAAVAAVSAAIAATAATNATRADRRRRAATVKAAEDAAAAAAAPPEIPAIAAATPIEIPEPIAIPAPIFPPAPPEIPAIAAATAAAAPLVPAPLVPAPVAPAPLAPLAAAALAASTPSISSPLPVTVPDYIRAPGREVSGLIRGQHPEDDAPPDTAAAGKLDLPTNRFRPDPPEVIGLTRAHIADSSGETFRPAVEPLFSNEGFARQKVTESGWKARIGAAAAGVAAALLAAGSALADKAGPRLTSVKSGLGTVPDRVRGATATARQGKLASRVGNGLRNFKETRPYAWIASAALAIRVGVVFVGSALAVVFLPIILGLSRFISVPANATSQWVANRGGAPSPDFDETGSPRRKKRVAPFWIAFAGFYTVLALIIGVVWVGSAYSSSPPSPGATHFSTATPFVAAAAETATPTVSPTASPTATPTATPSPTAKPTPVPTKKPTPVPTKKPTPKPTKMKTAPPAPPTPAPTPILSVSLNSPPRNTSVKFTVKFTVGSSCTLNGNWVVGTGNGNPPNNITTSTETIVLSGGSGTSGNVSNGRNRVWTYTVTCGSYKSSTVTVTWGA